MSMLEIKKAKIPDPETEIRPVPRIGTEAKKQVDRQK